MTVPCAALVLALGLAFGQSSQGNDEESEYSGQSITEEENSEDETTRSALATVTTEALAENVNSTHTNDTSNQVEFILMVAIPLAALLILLFMVLIATYFKSKRPKQEPSSQGSQSALQTRE
uniref:Isoform 2 of Transmembrane protein 154 n=1 Tax=Mus musculus TaxID=10090 RepID=Q8C4Q9-2|nr:unnamed protein product [Mus musculus]